MQDLETAISQSGLPFSSSCGKIAFDSTKTTPREPDNYLFGDPGIPVASITERTTGAPRLVGGEEAAEMRFSGTVCLAPCPASGEAQRKEARKT